MKIGKLQFITNYQSSTPHVEQVKKAIDAGIDWIQYRPKNVSEEQILLEGTKIIRLCKAAGVTCIINDNVAIAKSIDADGVHLGKSDMPPSKARELLGNNKIIGGTSNTLKDIMELIAQGVDYIGLGPYRFTTTKKNLSPTLGIEGYRFILNELKKNNISIPIVAIGGITEIDIKALMRTEIHGIALSSLISEATNIDSTTTELQKLINY